MTVPSPMSLDGIRVLDLSRILAAPSCTQLLGDLGADVVKIERPASGDDTRGWGPPFAKDAHGRDTDLSAYFLCANRNKRSLAVDLASESGAELIRQLAARADVIVENYKPGDLTRRGLDYDSIRRVKPDIVWCSVTGFGHTGPYASRVGYDFLVQAMGGLMSITGAPDEEGGEPMKVGVGVSDLMCGMYAAVAILAALRHRDRTGEGQFIDCALFDTQVSWLVNVAANYLVSGEAPGRIGNEHPNIVPYQTFKAADGHLCVAVGNDRQFAEFCRVLGAPHLSEDPRFATNRARVSNRKALQPILAAIIAQRPVAEWADALVAASVPAGPVLSIPEVLANEHSQARGLIIEMEDEVAGPVKLLGNPLKMSGTPPRYRMPPPHLNEDRLPVLRDWLDAGDREIADLARSGAFGAGVAEAAE